MEIYIGVDIGGTNTRIAQISGDGRIISSERFPTFSFQEWDQFSLELANRICNLDTDNIVPKGVGIAVPGTVDVSQRELVYAPNLGWENIAFSDYLEQKTGYSVLLENDANMAALGEHLFGKFKGNENGIVLTLGTGIGGGIILNSKLYRGKAALSSEPGHMIIRHNGNQCSCGLKGCFETYASATAFIRISKRIFTEKGIEFPDTEEACRKTPERVANEYRDGKDWAKEIFQEYCDGLACGIGSLVNVFGPIPVVLSGGIMKSCDIVISLLMEKLDSYVFPSFRDSMDVTASQLVDRAGLLGAVALLRGNNE